ncbi:MAG: DUF104 domain-containing protein [Saprospiraceae bacterium]|nr:DUF104 domain-containing protein [Saprospiraceae bacterium]
MTEIITAIYEKGNLRLLKPLPLPDKSEIQIQILNLPSTERQKARSVLVEAGILVEPAQLQKASPVSEEALSLSAMRLAQAGSLSEQIIAARDEA